MQKARSSPIASTNRGASATNPPAREPVATPQPPIEQPIHPGRLPIMIASLPSMASGADVYARQFYRGSSVPFRRYLPIIDQQ